MPESDQALLDVMRILRNRQYSFVTPTPLTHSRVLARADHRNARTIRDIFGWNMPFIEEVAGADLFALMKQANVLLRDEGRYRSAIRVSTLNGLLFAHSAYPTLGDDAVFFGPDTYRFARFIKQHLPAQPKARASRCVDVGCGSGAGAISSAVQRPGSSWLLTDINPAALRLAAINARHAGVDAEIIKSDVLAAVRDNFDLIVCNPPYICDLGRRTYRHGGDSLGRDLSLRIVAEGKERLNPRGRLLLYTGIAIVDGIDPFVSEVRELLDDRRFSWDYFEIDPDVFGEELEQPAYLEVDRIAVVGLVVTCLPQAGANLP